MRINLKKIIFIVLGLFIVILLFNIKDLNIKLIGSNTKIEEASENKELKVITQCRIISSVTVRKGDSSSDDALVKLSEGDKVDIVEDASNGWYKIKYKDGYGYILKKYAIAILDKFLFVGDSYTDLLRSTIEANASDTIIRAKSGCYPSYWLDNFDKMPNPSKVEGVCLLIGVNGMDEGYYKTNVKDTEILIKKLSNKYSNKEIYVQKVFPLGDNYPKVKHKIKLISEFNQEIEDYCKTMPNVEVIDTTEGLVDDKGYLKYHDSDGIHIKYDKYDKFFNNIGREILKGTLKK